MKRTAISLLLALALVLCAVLVTAPQAQAVTQPCSGNHTDWTELPTAGGELEAKNYYVKESATLTAPITIAEGATVTICLNGKTLTAPADATAIKLSNAGATLKICDCSGNNAGTLKGNGTVSTNGGVIYVSAASTLELYSGTITGGKTGDEVQGGNVCLNAASAVFNMYDGKITKGEAAYRGGNVAINKGTMTMFDGEISDGTALRGGNIITVANTNVVTIKAGVISGGSASQRGGNINVDKSNLVVEGGSITGAKGEAGTNIQFNDSGKLNGTKLLDALDAANITVDGIVHMGKWNNLTARAETFKLYSDIPSTYSVAFGEQDRYLDLNGHSFAGTFDASAVTGSNTSKTTVENKGQYTLFVFDSSTSDYTTVSTGVYTGTISNIPEGITIKKADNGVAIVDRGYERYLEINGTYQRFSLGVDAVSLELDADGNVDLGYSALIKGNSAVKGALSSFGIYVGKAETYETGKQPKAKQAADFDAGEAGNKVTLRVDDVMTAGSNANKDADVKVQAFIKVGTTEIVGNDAVSVSVQDIVDAAAKQLTEKPEEAATYPEFYALIEKIKNEYTITVTAAA